MLHKIVFEKSENRISFRIEIGNIYCDVKQVLYWLSEIDLNHALLEAFTKNIVQHEYTYKNNLKMAGNITQQINTKRSKKKC